MVRHGQLRGEVRAGRGAGGRGAGAGARGRGWVRRGGGNSFDVFKNLKQSSHAEQKFVFDERLTFEMVQMRKSK